MEQRSLTLRMTNHFPALRHSHLSSAVRPSPPHLADKAEHVVAMMTAELVERARALAVVAGQTDHMPVHKTRHSFNCHLGVLVP